MGAVYNIRGTNGAGKSRLARAFLPESQNVFTDHGGPLDLNRYDAPTKRDPRRQLRVPGYGWTAPPPVGDIGVVGSYRTACGGLDGVPSFSIQQEAIWYMLDHIGVKHVIAEGVISSTVYGSWADFDDRLAASSHDYAWCYLDTPLDMCFKHIRLRQLESGGGIKPIKEQLVADKRKAILTTRARALADKRLVYDLPWETAAMALQAIMSGEGEPYRAHS